MSGFSNVGARKVGKPGRPPNDAICERLRIYRAAGPLILERGVRGTTIAAVARLAFLSPAGIYHYFPSKRQLMLYGLDPEALARACGDESAALHAELAAGPSADLARIIDLYVDKSVRMLDFVRPALQAAIEYGRPELQSRLSAGLEADADFLMSALATLVMSPIAAEDSANAIRRTILGLALDEDVTAAQARRQLLWLFRRLVPAFEPA